jgi:hypothetical protein
MARLPGERYLIQQSDGIVTLFEEGTEREIVRIPVLVPAPGGQDGDMMVNADGFARAQKTIHDSDLSDEEKVFAHFWSGYFYAHADPGAGS